VEARQDRFCPAVQNKSANKRIEHNAECLQFEICNLRFDIDMYPTVDQEKCNGCRNCVEICPSEVYQIEEDKSNPIHPEDCIECLACVNQCPTESIHLYED
jgi:NAD-dependent dihydropyrimidine dehydrogenase PreA subunit